MRPPAEYIAMQIIPGPTGVRAYNPGDDVPAHAVESLGLQVGVEIRPAHGGVIPRPARNARRADWEKYWLGQGLDQDGIDAMTRDEMADREPPDPGDGVNLVSDPLPDLVAIQGNELTNGPPVGGDEPYRPTSGSRKADWVEYAVEMGMPRQVAEDSTIDQLGAVDYDLYR